MQIRDLWLVLIPLRATCVIGLPTAPAELSVLQSALNQTFDMVNPVNTTDDSGHMLERRRGEIGRAVCRHQYNFFYEEWIVQVPKGWWKERYQGDAHQACRTWRSHLLDAAVCGMRVTECWEMDKQYPSGAPEWLHARLTTCVGPHMSSIEKIYPTLFDVETEDHKIACRYGFS